MTRADRRARRQARRAGAVVGAAAGPLLSRLPPAEVLSAEGVERVHEASMRLLRDVGILVLDHPPARETLRRHGARVDGDVVRLDADTVMHFVGLAPPAFTQLARNPARAVAIGGRHVVFAPVYGPPFVSTLDRGRRPATLADFQDLVRLTHVAETLHHGGGTLCEPTDVEPRERHLDMLLAHLTLGDRAFMGSVTHADHARDSVAMARIVFGAGALARDPAVLALVNASSPLRFDDRMLGALEVYARARQAVLVTPFIIAGAMSPAAVAATLAQQNAEALFGIAYAQMLEPGTPCVYGSFLAAMDMRSGAPCFGTPEDALALYAGAQMARRYRLPYRSGGNLTAARIPDAQAGYESAATMWPTVQAGTNFVLHAAGWLEGGLVAGYEKFVLDLEVCGMMARLVRGVGLEEEDFAWDAYAETGPGQDFVGARHTLRHCETAFYRHTVFSMDGHDKWVEEGSQDAYRRANALWKRMLRAYDPPAVDPSVGEELGAFVAHRRAEIRADRPRTEWRG